VLPHVREEDVHGRSVEFLRSPGDALEAVNAPQPQLQILFAQLIDRLDEPVRELQFEGDLQLVQSEIEAGEERDDAEAGEKDFP
jgi:hypothetical protein